MNPASASGTPARWGSASGAAAVLLAAVAVVALFGLHVARFAVYVNDDAYITFRYSRNLADGVGPYFNAGEHVEGYTNPSLMLAMALVDGVAGPDSVPGAAKALGGLAAAASLLFCLGIARRSAGVVEFSELEAWSWGLLAAGLTAVSPGFAVNSMSGLETALMAMCLTGAVWCDSGPRPSLRGLVLWLGLAVLTRPEGILIAGVYLGTRLVADRLGPEGPGDRGGSSVSGTLLAGGLVVAVFGLQLGMRWLLYDGELLPNTYYAKAGGFWGTGAWDYVRQGALVPLFGVAGAALALIGWLAPGRARAALLPLAATSVVGAGLPFITGTDWMIGWRFSAPYLPLLALTVTFGWVRVTAIGGVRRDRLAASLLIAIPLAWMAQAEVRRQLAEHVAVKAEGYRNGHAALAEWLLDGRIRPGDQIALMDIGIVSYRAIEQRIIDITGLTDRVIAKSPGEFLKKEYEPSYVLDQKPEFIVLAFVLASDPSAPPVPGAPLFPWSALEKRLADDPSFDTFYRRPSRRESPSNDPLVQLASRLGAERVFLHNDPEIHYLLAVFPRREADA